MFLRFLYNVKKKKKIYKLTQILAINVYNETNKIYFMFYLIKQVKK